jgi:hypothetical protein
MAADARAASSDVSITAQTNRECESTSDRQSVRCISARNTANTERLLGPNCMYPYMIHSHSPSPLHTCRSRCPLGRVSVRQCRNVVTQPDFPHNLVPNLASRPKSDPSPWPRHQAARPDPQFGHRPAPLTIIPESVNGREEVRAGGHEISGSVDIKLPDVWSLKTGGGPCRWSASLVEWVHALAGEGVGEAV